MTVRNRIALFIFAVILLVSIISLIAGRVIVQYRYTQTVEHNLGVMDQFFQQIPSDQAEQYKNDILFAAQNSLSQSKHALFVYAFLIMLFVSLIALSVVNNLSAACSKIDEQQKTTETEVQAKTRFLSVVSHRMRTPLNTVMGLSEIELERGKLPNESLADMERIRSHGKNLLTIIDDILGVKETETTTATDTTPAAATATANTAQKLVRPNMSYAAVLVVDDVPTNLDVARGMLELYGMKVDCVESGEEAVKQIREAKVHYDAIFMDQMMPGMDGSEALKIIRTEIDSDYARTIPIIVLTADVLMGNDRLYVFHGYQAFIPKPIDPRRLDNVLNLLVRDVEKEKNLPPLPEKVEHQPEGIFDGAILADLNVKDVLVMLENDEDTYLRILQTYVGHTPNYLEKVRTEGKDDINDYRIAVHGIKGSSRGIGAAKLGLLAEKLEDAAKRNDLAFIAKHNAPFIAAVEQLLANLGVFLAEVSAKKSSGKPERPAPDPQLVRKILTCCEDYDIRGLRRAIEALGTYNYTSSPDLVPWIEQQADLSNFTEIQKRLESI